MLASTRVRLSPADLSLSIFASSDVAFSFQLQSGKMALSQPYSVRLTHSLGELDAVHSE